jgi:hypothetical protein
MPPMSPCTDSAQCKLTNSRKVILKILKTDRFTKNDAQKHRDAESILKKSTSTGGTPRGIKYEKIRNKNTNKYSTFFSSDSDSTTGSMVFYLTNGCYVKSLSQSIPVNTNTGTGIV